MEIKDLWHRFVESGKVTDYLYFLDFCRESEDIGRTRLPLYDRSTCNKGNEDRGE